MAACALVPTRAPSSRRGLLTYGYPGSAPAIGLVASGPVPVVPSPVSESQEDDLNHGHLCEILTMEVETW